MWCQKGHGTLDEKMLRKNKSKSGEEFTSSSLQVTFTFTTAKKLDSICPVLHFREHQNVKSEIL